MAKYQKTGAIEHVNKHQASYGYATSDDFQTSLEIVARGRDMFNELPSSIRTKFENDPAKFLDFVQNEENLQEMQEMGLAHKLQQPDPSMLNIVENLEPTSKKYKEGIEKNVSETNTKSSTKTTETNQG